MTVRKLALPLAGLAAALAMAGCTTVPMASDVLGTAQLTRGDGAQAGTIQLVRANGELRVEGMLMGLTPGQHGFHLHTTGRCDAPDFQSAGGHLNPYSRQHGKMNPAGKHLGDLDNIMVSPAGTVTVSQSVGSDTAADLAQIFDTDGTAVMVHTGVDDYRTDPTGDAGSRAACGVLRR